jgi:outer membrane lipoprotein-sorting protein
MVIEDRLFGLLSSGINIMKSPVVKLAIAALVIVVFVAGLSVLDKSSGLSLANVLAKMDKISAYRYEMSMISRDTTIADKPTIKTMQSFILISQEYGLKISMSLKTDKDKLDPNQEQSISSETYILPQKKTAISINHTKKQYNQTQTSDALMEQMKNQNYDPRWLVKLLLKNKYNKLGKSTVNGFDVEGFQATDQNYQGNELNKTDVKIWVDMESQLPSAVEINLQKGTLQIKALLHDFKWLVPVKAADFEPNIPKDYAPIPST